MGSDGGNRTLAIEGFKLPPQVSGDMQAVLVLVYPPGPNLGRRFPLEKESHVVGRQDTCDVPIGEDAVSRQHARVFREGLVWQVEDLGSTNGSFVNDQRLQRPTPLRDGDMLRFGTAILKFLSGSNIESAYHEAIYNMTILDGLTGVHNKRYFLEFLERELARSIRYQSPLSLVMFDIDHFKSVNDTHGHLAGDEVLRELGRRLKPRVRREDLLARYGGEEFACVLANTPRESALHFAEDFRMIIARDPFHIDAVALPITVSLGVADLTSQARRGEELIAICDQNLYAAKHGGRNQVVG
jgi:two-component system cell cycle response regulator